MNTREKIDEVDARLNSLARHMELMTEPDTFYRGEQIMRVASRMRRLSAMRSWLEKELHAEQDASIRAMASGPMSPEMRSMDAAWGRFKSSIAEAFGKRA